jgi:hypothetical protein
MRWTPLLALAWMLAGPGNAEAAVLVELMLGAEPMRLVIDRPQQRVLMTRGDRRTWFDLSHGLVYHQDGPGPAQRAHARYRPGHEPPPPYRIERFGPGPIVAGQASTYHVLFLDERICAEVMLSPWMRSFLDPATRAIALLQQMRGPRADDPCAGIPLATYAAAGWPLLAGKADRPTLVTRSVAFDYVAAAGELTPPADAVDVPAEALAQALGSDGW